MKYLIGIDAGLTKIKAAGYDERRNIIINLIINIEGIL